MSKLQRTYLITTVLVLSGAYVVQTFYPGLGGGGTAWGLAPGWQREIGFWNVSMLVILLEVLFTDSRAGARMAAGALMTLGLLLGGNHLFALLDHPEGWAHYTPMLLNFVGVGLAGLTLWPDRAKTGVMGLAEKKLYHQINPLKLLTDWGTAPPMLVLLWAHRLLPALLIGLVPPVVISLYLIVGTDLNPYKESPFGGYVLRHMTPAMETIRLAGLVVAAVGAWVHQPWLIPAGVVVILIGWTRGLWYPWLSRNG